MYNVRLLYLISIFFISNQILYKQQCNKLNNLCQTSYTAREDHVTEFQPMRNNLKFFGWDVCENPLKRRSQLICSFFVLLLFLFPNAWNLHAMARTLEVILQELGQRVIFSRWYGKKWQHYSAVILAFVSYSRIIFLGC